MMLNYKNMFLLSIFVLILLRSCDTLLVERVEDGDKLLDILTEEKCKPITGSRWHCDVGKCFCSCASVSPNFHINKCYTRQEISLKECKILIPEVSQIPMILATRAQIIEIGTKLLTSTTTTDCKVLMYDERGQTWTEPNISIGYELLFADWAKIAKELNGKLLKGWCGDINNINSGYKCMVLKANGTVNYFNDVPMTTVTTTTITTTPPQPTTIAAIATTPSPLTTTTQKVTTGIKDKHITSSKTNATIAAATTEITTTEITQRKTIESSSIPSSTSTFKENTTLAQTSSYASAKKCSELLILFALLLCSYSAR